MTFYQELQVNQAGSKKIIRESASQREKAVPYCRVFDQNCDNRRILLCFRFTLQSGFGADNSIVGVVVLLYLLVFRSAHLCIRTGQSTLLLAGFSALWPSDRMQPIWPARSADCSSMLLRLPCSFCSAATNQECSISPHSCSAICCYMVTM